MNKELHVLIHLRLYLPHTKTHRNQFILIWFFHINHRIRIRVTDWVLDTTSDINEQLFVSTCNSYSEILNKYKVSYCTFTTALLDNQSC